MSKSLIAGIIILLIAFSGCSNPGISNESEDQVSLSALQNKLKMKNLVSIIEIPTSDFSRAVAFYKSILNIDIEEVDMGEDRLGLFPNEEESGSIHLIYGSNYKPSSDGTIIYLNAGDDLQIVADKIEKSGGKILVPKTEIGPEMGFFALFLDTEVNRLGLYSGN